MSARRRGCRSWCVEHIDETGNCTGGTVAIGGLAVWPVTTDAGARPPAIVVDGECFELVVRLEEAVAFVEALAATVRTVRRS